MAPALMENIKRYLSSCDPAYYNCYYSTWDSWGRWVTLTGIILFILFVALVFSSINSRRRRRSGMRPYYGTGWLAGKAPAYNNNPVFYGHQGPPAPPYSPPVNNQYTGNTLNNSDGYYGQQSGIELQQPQHAYTPRGGDPVYEVPVGAPPSKGGYQNDGVIR